MLITIDTAMAAVYQSGGLLDVAMQVANVRSVRDLSFTSTRDPVCRKLEAHFKNRLIKTRTTSDRTKTIYAIVPGPIGNYPFQKDGVPTTIEVRLLNPRLDQTNQWTKASLISGLRYHPHIPESLRSSDLWTERPVPRRCSSRAVQGSFGAAV
jgi:hypothetical protein